MVKHQKQHRSKKKLLIVIAVVTVVLALGAGAYFMFFKENGDATKPRKYEKTSTGHDVNLDPATDEEKEEAEQAKDDAVKEERDGGTGQTGNQPPQSDTKSVNPFITFAGAGEASNIEVTGYVSGVFEDGGTCRAIFTKDSLRVTGESKGIADADHTTCPPITVARNQFTQTGNWTVVLEYVSSSARGTSKQARSVVIQ